MRRIDLLAKLLAPVLISLIYDYSFTVAIWVVFAQNTLSVLVEYFAIAQVSRPRAIFIQYLQSSFRFTTPYLGWPTYSVVRKQRKWRFWLLQLLHKTR